MSAKMLLYIRIIKTRMITTPLHLIRFQPDFASWLRAAHYLLQQGIVPSAVEWLECDDPAKLTPLPEALQARWNEEFLRMARLASYHRCSERWAVLYRVLWQLVHGHSRLMRDCLNPEVNRLRTLAREVEKDVRHLVTATHFETVNTPDGAVQVGRCQPRQHSVELAAPYFARRWGNTRWQLCTPDRCVQWNGRQLVYTPGEPVTDPMLELRLS